MQGVWITPAYAGKRPSCRRSACRIRDHPRVCGEKAAIQEDAARTPGSPPRMRGKAHDGGVRHVKSGITPAYAGKSSCHSGQSQCCGDHPRVCGEKTTVTRWKPRATGSPPRMRGKEPTPVVVVVSPGITPAHAGKRFLVRPCWLGSWDHPRACGEKCIFEHSLKMFVGSPPRMRGKAETSNDDKAKARITPAHAGKSRQRGHLPGQKKDHPRACGEKGSNLFYSVYVEGSPPRMRGKD